jgi:hypothetical protein
MGSSSSWSSGYALVGCSQNWCNDNSWKGVILGSGLFAGEQSVEVFDVHSGQVLAGELAARLG